MNCRSRTKNPPTRSSSPGTKPEPFLRDNPPRTPSGTTKTSCPRPSSVRPTRILCPRLWFPSEKQRQNCKKIHPHYPPVIAIQTARLVFAIDWRVCLRRTYAAESVPTEMLCYLSAAIIPTRCAKTSECGISGVRKNIRKCSLPSRKARSHHTAIAIVMRALPLSIPHSQLYFINANMNRSGCSQRRSRMWKVLPCFSSLTTGYTRECMVSGPTQDLYACRVRSQCWKL